MSVPHRPYAELPERLHSALVAKAKANGDELDRLFYYWIIGAARMVREGAGDLLPAVNPDTHRAPSGSVAMAGKPRACRWRQSRESYAECRDLIRGAGSSVPAVLREGARCYVADESATPALSWPPFRVLPAAA